MCLLPVVVMVVVVVVQVSRRVCQSDRLISSAFFELISLGHRLIVSCATFPISPYLAYLHSLYTSLLLSACHSYFSF